MEKKKLFGKRGEDEKPSELVVNQETAPCGCHFTEYGDGRKVRIPCVPHAFDEAARALMQVADMLGHIGNSMLRAKQALMQHQMNQAVNKVIQDGKEK